MIRKEENRPSYWCHTCQAEFTANFNTGKDNILCPNCRNDFCELINGNSSAKMFKPYQKQPRKKQCRQLKINKGANVVNLIEIHQLLEQQNHQKQGIQVTHQQLKVYQKVLQTDSECSVCRQDLKSGSRQLVFECRHSFHQQCLVEWLKIKNSCPTCRHKMIPQ